MLCSIRRFLMSKAAAFTKFMSKIRMPYSRKKITSSDYHALERILSKGYVLLSHTEGEISNWFIPDFWSHGAIYVGYIDGVPTVAEATASKGVILTDLIEFVMTKDYISVFRPTFLDKVGLSKAAAYAREKKGLEYDWMFETPSANNKAFYCFELVAVALESASNSKVFVPKEYMGVPTFTGSDFVYAVNKFEYVWCNDPSKLNK